eukprot:4666038-Lingulodinium_polyedra.AAC.1
MNNIVIIEVTSAALAPTVPPSSRPANSATIASSQLCRRHVKPALPLSCPTSSAMTLSGIITVAVA